MNRKKVDVLITVGRANSVVKYGSMLTAICGFARHMKHVPVVGTGICFASVIAEAVIAGVISGEVRNANTEPDEFDDDESCTLCDIADEYGDGTDEVVEEDDPSDDDFQE